MCRLGRLGRGAKAASVFYVRVVLASVVLASCTPRVVDFAPNPGPESPVANGSGDPIPGLLSLQVTPGSRDVTSDGSALGSRVVFHATGRTASGTSDVTALVEWSLARPEVGTIAGGSFRSAAVGGVTEVRARAGDILGTAQLRVRLDVVRSRGLPDDAVSAFADESGDLVTGGPQIVYPPADITLPSNLTHLRYQWRAPEELDAFEVRIESANARLRYYTGDREWLDNAETSRFLAASNAGDSVTIRVRAFASAAPDVVYRSGAVNVQVAAASVPGAALYWSSTARGIKRGELDADHAARVVTDPAGATADTCTGCHALSRDGKHLAVADGTDRLALFTTPEWTPQTFDAAAMPMMPMMPKGAKAMTPPAPMGAPPAMPEPPPMAAMPGMAVPPMRPPVDYGWGSFNPDGTQLAYAAKGKLHVLDTSTGAELPKVRLPPDTNVNHPDWSPDGAYIAVTYLTGPGKAPKGNKLVRGSSIARLHVLEDGMFGDPEIVVASAGPDDTLSFPTFAPDGRWIAFARAVGASKDNPSSQLWIVAADGSSAPVSLERANRVPGVDLTLSAAANTLPTWAPSTDDTLPFLAFSSTRDYGDVVVDAHRDQLWASAIDLDALAAGREPSAPPFWLPFQDPLENNHRALWLPASDACVPGAEVCDERDDDCDGKVDETCCGPPSPEDCGDMLDNDCDGVVNEGCGCSDVEICDNAKDDDCDQHVDEDCKE
jgi:hypothetical protein